MTDFLDRDNFEGIEDVTPVEDTDEEPIDNPDPDWDLRGEEDA